MLVEREAPGGQAGSTSRIENYLGFPSGLSGADLARRALAQATPARRRGGLRPVGDGRDRGRPVQGRVAGGRQPRQLRRAADRHRRRSTASSTSPAPIGSPARGIYYGAATTEAPCLPGRGGRGRRRRELGRPGRGVPRALREARDDARPRARPSAPGCPPTSSTRSRATPNITVRLNAPCRRGPRRRGARGASRVAEGDPAEEHAARTGGHVRVHRTAPRTDWLGGLVARDTARVRRDRARPDPRRRPRRGLAARARQPFLLETSVPGVFSAGDVRSRSVKRIASAVGEGSMAVQFVHQHLSTL